MNPISDGRLESPGVTCHSLRCQNSMNCPSKTAPGFTLVELLIVVATISLLSALLLTSISAAKRKAQWMTCINNLRQIALGVRLYSDDSQDASPSPGWAGLAATNVPSLYSGYTVLMQNYVGRTATSSSPNQLFQCPADTFYPNWIIGPVSPPLNFVPKSLHEAAVWNYSSYAFNGGDNLAHKFFNNTFAYPGLGGVKLSSVKHPVRTVLVTEIAALGPWSWHNPSSHGVAHASGTLYNDSQNVVSFVDGHVSYIKMHWRPGQVWSASYEPPSGYEYQWSPD